MLRPRPVLDEAVQVCLLDSDPGGVDVRRLQVDERRALFRDFDRDGNGVIEASDLEAIMRDMGFTLSTTEVRNMLREVDASGDGVVDCASDPRYAPRLVRHTVRGARCVASTSSMK